MVLRAALITGCLIAASVVDSAWLSRLPWGPGPDLLLLMVLSVGLRRGLTVGALIGAVAGYLHDLTTGGPLGVYTFSYLALGATAGAASPMVDLQQRAMPVAVAVLGTLMLTAVSALTVTVTGVAPAQWPSVGIDAAVAVILNALLARPVDAVVRGIDRLTQRRYTGRVIGHRVLR
jgi:rod shape-determining protein MreD